MHCVLSLEIKPFSVNAVLGNTQIAGVRHNQIEPGGGATDKDVRVQNVGSQGVEALAGGVRLSREPGVDTAGAVTHQHTQVRILQRAMRLEPTPPIEVFSNNPKLKHLPDFHVS